MALGSLSERLALIIEADPTKATAAFRKVGDAAAKDLGRAESSIDKVGSQMRTVGAGAVAFGGVMLLGLGKAASASEDADKQLLKLQNSMANNPNLAGQSSKAFTDLAESIMHKTAADDDAIISGEAVLAQMGLTADQITELTPLVVDLSRKMGVDMDTAAKTVAKSVDGSTGALRKMGISVDSTAAKTDAFGATVEALRGSVGGFAEQEGQTFAGQLERLKNELHNVEEGVGKGVVQAFSSMIGVVDKVTGALEKLNPGTQAAIGQLATYAAAGLVAVGATASLVGQLIKIRGAFTTVTGEGADATRSLTTMGKAMSGVVAVGTVASLYEVGKAMNHVNFDAQELARTSTDVLVKGFIELAHAGDLFGVSFEQRFKDLAEQSYGTAVRIRDGFKAAGESTAEMDKILQSEAAAQRQSNQDTQDGTDAITGETKAVTTANDAWKTYADRLDTAREAQSKLVDSVEDHERALLDQLDAQAREQAVMADSTATMQDQANAILDLADANVAAAGAQNDATQKAAIQKATLEQIIPTLAPGSALRVYLEDYIATLNSIPLNISTLLQLNSVTVTGGGGSGFIPGYGGPQASGGDYLVRKPTWFLAGEAGAERATFTPLSRGTGHTGGSGRGVTNHVNVTVVTPQPAPTVIAREIRKLAYIWPS